MDREQIERECVERTTRYIEELKKFKELLSQLVSMRQVQVGKAMVSPMRAFDAMGFEEAKQKLDKLHQEMDEACDRLFEAHH
jgi:hypothetical protein